MVEDDWVATLLRNRYRDDFIVEPPLAPCRRGALVRPHGIGVRLLARNSEIARHILRGFDHSRDDAIALDRLRQDRKSVVSGKSVYVRVDLGGRRIIKKTNTKN